MRTFRVPALVVALASSLTTAVFLARCGIGSADAGGSVLSGGNQSGSRLKARYVVAEDGAQEFSGWFDSKRNELCARMYATDRTDRCLPVGIPTAAAGDPYFYADPSCTKRAIQLRPKPCQPSSVAGVQVFTNDVCRPGTLAVNEGEAAVMMRVYRAEREVPGPFYQRHEDSCDEWKDAPPARALLLGDEIPPTEFVAFTDVK